MLKFNSRFHRQKETDKKARKIVEIILDIDFCPSNLSMSIPHLPPSKDHNLIEFNCLGTIFLIRESSLNRFPNTLLGFIYF
jgi:hypothetical protein